MANFTEHHLHALDNIHHLGCLNEDLPGHYRWQVVTSHYIALQLLHAFLANEANYHPENHHQLKDAINPHSRMTAVRLDPSLYVAYEQLDNVSRKARYNSEINFTEVHVIKAIKFLDPLIHFFNKKYPKAKVPAISFFCTGSKHVAKLNHIQIVERIIAA